MSADASEKPKGGGGKEVAVSLLVGIGGLIAMGQLSRSAPLTNLWAGFAVLYGAASLFMCWSMFLSVGRYRSSLEVLIAKIICGTCLLLAVFIALHGLLLAYRSFTA